MYLLLNASFLITKKFLKLLGYDLKIFVIPDAATESFLLK